VITEEAALAHVLECVRALPSRRVSLFQALGQFAAGEVFARLALPVFDNSAMDGYAVVAGACRKGQSQRVIGEQPAGVDRGLRVAAGEAVRLFTGAPMPAGADAVIMQEDVRREGAEIFINAEVEPGEFIRRRGSDLSEGQKILGAGQQIGAQTLALLASQGLAAIEVGGEVRAAIITTGDELVPPGGPLRAGQIYESNSTLVHALYPFLIAAAYRRGDLSVVFPIARGMSPLGVAAFLALTQGAPPVEQLAGVGLIVLGIVLLVVEPGRSRERLHPQAIAYACATGCVVAVYTFLDGSGVRLTDTILSYIVWLVVLEVTVVRDGQVASMAFSGGDVVDKLRLRKAKADDRAQGTTVRVWPDPKYFESSDLPREHLMHLLRSKAVLMPGVTVSLEYEKSGDTQAWLFKGGLRDYLTQSLTGEPVIPLFEGEQFASEAETENVAEGEGAAWCVAFTEDGQPLRESYVNLIPTVAGGTHEAGLREGLFAAVRAFVDLHALLPKGVKLMPDDVFSRASFVLSAKVLDPQFQGQIKERLNSRDALRLVAQYVRPAFELWLNQHVEHARKLADLVIRQAQTRQKYIPLVEKTIPGKKAALFFQIDRRVQMMIDLQLASSIPLIQPEQP
jgi:hypothetical protein